MQQFLFNTKDEFLIKLKELISNGVSKKDISLFLPYYITEIDSIIKPKSNLKFFTLLGSITGFITGFSFTSYTVKKWSLIVGGKPIIAIPVFVIIAFELTILFGALASFLGFLILTKLPQIKYIISSMEYGNKFVIIIQENK
jgi:hypothetical protein